MTKVVDASAIAAVLFAEPAAADVVALLADDRLGRAAAPRIRTREYLRHEVPTRS